MLPSACCLLNLIQSYRGKDKYTLRLIKKLLFCSSSPLYEFVHDKHIKALIGLHQYIMYLEDFVQRLEIRLIAHAHVIHRHRRCLHRRRHFFHWPSMKQIFRFKRSVSKSISCSSRMVCFIPYSPQFHRQRPQLDADATALLLTSETQIFLKSCRT